MVKGLQHPTLIQFELFDLFNLLRIEQPKRQLVERTPLLAGRNDIENQFGRAVVGGTLGLGIGRRHQVFDQRNERLRFVFLQPFDQTCDATETLANLFIDGFAYLVDCAKRSMGSRTRLVPLDKFAVWTAVVARYPGPWGTVF